MKAIILSIILSIPIVVCSQNTPGTIGKVTTTAEQKTSQALQASQASAAQLKMAIENIKGITKVFEPIFGLHKKKQESADYIPQESIPVVDTTVATLPQQPQEEVTIPSEPPQVFIPESSLYNADGTANWGSQNHTEYGSYLDVMKGSILDDISVVMETASVDLIFTATNHFGNSPAYAFLTPAYVKNDFFANYYFRGPKYKDANVPPMSWDNVNESEVAMTTLTEAHFNRIQTNDQLTSFVKQIRGFQDHIESRTKLTGKVIAVKTEMANRTCYGIILILEHYGTTGANGFLKVKIKVTGFDYNQDGNPDAEVYQSY